MKFVNVCFLQDAQFMEGKRSSENSGQGSGLTQKEICDKLTELLRQSSTTLDDVVGWIDVSSTSLSTEEGCIFHLLRCTFRWRA